MSYSYEENYDYCTRLTRNGVLRSDGVIFTEDTFIESHRTKVPITSFCRGTAKNPVIGQAELVVKEDGVYAYCTFYETDFASIARKYICDEIDWTLGFIADHVNRDTEDERNVKSAKITGLYMIPKGAKYGYVDEK